MIYRDDISERVECPENVRVSQTTGFGVVSSQPFATKVGLTWESKWFQYPDIGLGTLVSSHVPQKMEPLGFV